MQELCCPNCGQRYSSPAKNCSKDGAVLVQFFPTTRELSSASTNDLSKTLQETPGMSGLLLRGLSMNLVPGMTVGEYVLQNKLGVGGMGEVWKAQQPTIGKMVAIKVLMQESATNKKSVARFVQEARAVNEIRHPNLVDIFSFGELPDLRPYFVMELLEGKSLANYMSSVGPLPFKDIFRIFAQVCEVLQAAHNKGIVHRDLKPDNIYLISRQSEALFVKVLDFGIAKLAGEGAQNLTDQGSVFGTPGYMSPEQYEETKNVDHRSDIYALGVLLFEMLTGRLPFDEPGIGMYELIIRQMSQPPPKPSQIITGRSIPEAVDALILQMLAKKPAERPSSCTEALSLFRRAAAPMKSESRVGQLQPQPQPQLGGVKTLELSSPLRDNFNEPTELTLPKPILELSPSLPEAFNGPTERMQSEPALELMQTIKSKKLPEDLQPTATMRPESSSPSWVLLAAGGAVILLSAVLTFFLMR